MSINAFLHHYLQDLEKEYQPYFTDLSLHFATEIFTEVRQLTSWPMLTIKSVSLESIVRQPLTVSPGNVYKQQSQLVSQALLVFNLINKQKTQNNNEGKTFALFSPKVPRFMTNTFTEIKCKNILSRHTSTDGQLTHSSPSLVPCS